jgi:DNA-binding response OmpR family regulator
MIVGGDPEGSATWAASLEAQGCRVQRETDPSQALATLRNERPDALVLQADGIDPAAIVPLRTAARSLGIPLLEVVDEAETPEGLAARHGEADDWVFRSRAAIELQPGRFAYSGARRKRRRPRPRPRWRTRDSSPSSFTI